MQVWSSNLQTVLYQALPSSRQAVDAFSLCWSMRDPHSWAPCQENIARRWNQPQEKEGKEAVLSLRVFHSGLLLRQVSCRTGQYVTTRVRPQIPSKWKQNSYSSQSPIWAWGREAINWFRNKLRWPGWLRTYSNERLVRIRSNGLLYTHVVTL